MSIARLIIYSSLGFYFWFSGLLQKEWNDKFDLRDCTVATLACVYGAFGAIHAPESI